jgi:hypothetical protein
VFDSSTELLMAGAQPEGADLFSAEPRTILDALLLEMIFYRR